jgi:hypothetical protein
MGPRLGFRVFRSSEYIVGGTLCLGGGVDEKFMIVAKGF